MANCFPKWCFHLGLLLFAYMTLVTAETLEEKMRSDSDISEFYVLLGNSTMANVSLQYKQITIFAPLNAAFQKLRHIKEIKEDPETLVLYHMISVPKRTDQLGTSYTSLYSELSGSPPLWITVTSGRKSDDIYVNNAKILVSQSNIQGTGSELTQVLHKINEVLIPTRSSKSAPNQIYNPTAWEFLDNYQSLIQHPHRVRNFHQKVQQNNKEDIFKTEGGHTFFIPVDEGFGNERAALIDDKIIDGHVIPKHVLFTTPTKKDVPFPTLANGDNDIRVVISFTQEKRGETIINYVKSHTLLGDGNHIQGIVLAEIVKANIPVKNGVIHLIHKPLMVVDSTVKELLQEHMDYICNIGVSNEIAYPTQPVFSDYSRYPEYVQYGINEKDGGILSSFVEAINNVGPVGHEFLKTIERSHGITLFAPCNKALDRDLNLVAMMKDKNKFMEILKMHVVVDEKLYVEKIRQLNLNKGYQAHTLSKGKNLYFNVVSSGSNRTLTVEGGGVTATVIQADLAATNGIIHIIDRVLGVPYITVRDKLESDPMLKDTYLLGELQGFNNRLNDTSKNYTYFVPRNKAWQDARVALPSAIKVLFMREYSYHATVTLERHLVVSDAPYTIERIKQLTKETDAYGQKQKIQVELPTLRGSLKLYVEEGKNNTYAFIWEERVIPIFRPNVECTNGIIHVIDLPFLKQGDIQISSATIFTLAPQLLMISIAKFLLL